MIPMSEGNKRMRKYIGSFTEAKDAICRNVTLHDSAKDNLREQTPKLLQFEICLSKRKLTSIILNMTFLRKRRIRKEDKTCKVTMTFMGYAFEKQTKRKVNINYYLEYLNF
jgi:hypothetical protein